VSKFLCLIYLVLMMTGDYSLLSRLLPVTSRYISFHLFSMNDWNLIIRDYPSYRRTKGAPKGVS